jgi:hypothetical protein
MITLFIQDNFECYFYKSDVMKQASAIDAKYSQMVLRLVLAHLLEIKEE